MIYILTKKGFIREENRTQKLRKIKRSLQTLGIGNKCRQLMQKSKSHRLLTTKADTLQIDHFSSDRSRFGSISQKQSFTTSSEIDHLESNFDGSFQDIYNLKEKIGEGANGMVFICQHKKSNKKYAVKIMNFDDEHIAGLKKDFLNIRELCHPNIMKYKALYLNCMKRSAYVVMQYLKYKSLSNYKIKNEDELRGIVIQILKALKHIHSKNICHRDIKPQNILYDPETQKIKIIDFGTSKKFFLRGGRRDMLTITGTFEYMAPEVFIGGGYDEKVDIWALGITIFKIVTGYSPFESEYRSETIEKIVKGKFQFDNQRWQNYSYDLKKFVSNLLVKTKRMSAVQNLKHFWIKNQQLQSTITVKVLRYNSMDIIVNEQFHNEKMNRKNAFSKEQGYNFKDEITTPSYMEKPLFKNVNLMNLKEFDLMDSDNEDCVISRKDSVFGAIEERNNQFFTDI